MSSSHVHSNELLVLCLNVFVFERTMPSRNNCFSPNVKLAHDSASLFFCYKATVDRFMNSVLCTSTTINIEPFYKNLASFFMSCPPSAQFV